jgi:hypothetical protein
MLNKELTILKELWIKMIHLIGVMSDVPDGLVAIVSLLLVAFIVHIIRTCWSDANEGKGLRVFNYANGPRYSYARWLKNLM